MRPRRRGRRYVFPIAAAIALLGVAGAAVVHLASEPGGPGLNGKPLQVRISKPLALPGAPRRSDAAPKKTNAIRFTGANPEAVPTPAGDGLTRPVSLRPPPINDAQNASGNEIQAALDAALASPGVREALSLANKADLVATTETPTSLGSGAEPVASTGVPVQNLSAIHERVKVKQGESLYHIFKRLQLSQADLLEIAGSKGVEKALRTIRAGQRIELFADKNGSVEKLIYFKSSTTRLLIERKGGTFQSRKVETTAPSPQIEVPAANGENPLPRQVRRINIVVNNGDSMYSLFQHHGISTKDLSLLLESSRSAKTLKRIMPGQSLELLVAEDSSLAKLLYYPDEQETVEFIRDTKGGFSRRTITHTLTRKQVSSTGTIESSLFLAGQQAGLSDRLIMQLAEIFGWDVDFVLDIRRGDRFSVIFEELYRGDKKVRNSDIVAAEFVNQGRTIRALRYQAKDGHGQYFSPEGLSMRKAFLRSPVEFARISSRFSFARRHPILHKIRAHKGVDYAAARGTPVRASGDGKVAFAGVKGGYGRTIVLQHGSTYTTLYAHLHRFAKGARTGKRVRQGQVIGYVGSSGLATGPHLHYEFRVRGIHRDPLKVKLPKAAPIAKGLRQDFIDRTAALLVKLETLSQRVVAARP